MGIGHNFFTELKNYLGKKHLKSNLEELRGTTMGIDASKFKNEFIKSKDYRLSVMRNFTAIPKCDNSQLFCLFLNRKKAFFDFYDIKIVLVFDGGRNPLKEATNDNRSRGWVEAATKLHQMRVGEIEFDLTKMYEYSYKSVYVSDDLRLAMKEWCMNDDVKFLCAPVEADSQLVSLQFQGIIDAILTEDSDILVIGATKVVYQTIFNKDLKWKCNILTFDDLTAYGKSIDANMNSTEDTISFSLFHGCDYLKSPWGFTDSYIKTNMVSSGWLSMGDSASRLAILQHIETTGGFPNSDSKPNKQRVSAAGYANQFLRAFWQFRYPYIFRIVSNLECMSAKESFYEGSDGFTVELGNLNDISSTSRQISTNSIPYIESIPAYNCNDVIYKKCHDRQSQSVTAHL